MAVGTPLWDSVLHGLSQGLSPEQVSGLLSKRMDSTGRISHESIYSAIYAMPRGQLRSEVVALLRKSHKTTRALRCTSRIHTARGSAASMRTPMVFCVSISRRAPI